MKIGIDYIVDSFIIYNKKTYVMKIRGKDKPLIKGATLRNRKNELFLQEYIKNCINHILDSNYEECVKEYERWRFLIENQLLDAKHIEQKQSLKTSLEEYVSKVTLGDRNKDAIYEVALADTEVQYQKGDPVHIYVSDAEGNKKFEIAKPISMYNYDCNVKHYVKRLDETTKTILLPIFGVDIFNEMFKSYSIKIYKKDLDRLKSLEINETENEDS